MTTIIKIALLSIALLSTASADVYLCKTPVKGINIVDHYWLLTSKFERAMWNDQHTKISDVPFLTDVAVRNEEYHPDALCQRQLYVSEKKVNDQLPLHKKLGKWSPWNNCQTFALSVLRNAANDPRFKSRDNKETYPAWVKRSSLK